MSTSDQVVDILVQEGGYRMLPKPFRIGSQSFDFPHALVAANRANDLVIVIELRSTTSDEAVVRKVFALTRALDVLRSKRPVTAVLTCGQPLPETLQSISKVCRVLPIGAPSGPDALDAIRDWLAALLPLTQPPAVDTLFDWEADLRRVAHITAQDSLMEGLIAAATEGVMAVEEALAADISRAVISALDDKGSQP